MLSVLKMGIFIACDRDAGDCSGLAVSPKRCNYSNSSELLQSNRIENSLIQYNQITVIGALKLIIENISRLVAIVTRAGICNLVLCLIAFFVSSYSFAFNLCICSI